MIVAVFVKQVPMLIDLRFDTDEGRVVRDGVRLQNNPLDNIATLTAVAAFAHREEAQTVAVSMGPPQAEAAVRHAMGLGADRGVLVCDPLLAGSDTLATARALAAVVRRLGASLAVLGRHSIDAETGQTGAMVAGLLGWPLVSAVRDVRVVGEDIHARRDADDGTQDVEVALPAVVTVAESAGREQWPSQEDRERAAAATVERWDVATLGLQARTVGSAGSPTSVGAVRLVTTDRKRIRLSGEAGEVIDSLVAALSEAPAQRPPSARSSNPRTPGAGVWAVVEFGARGMRRVSEELVNAAAELAGTLGGHAVAVALDSQSAADIAVAGAWGAEAAIAVPTAGSWRGDPAIPAAALGALIGERRPGAVLLPSTTWGRDVAGMVCAQRNLGLTGDAIGFEIHDRQLLALKPALGGALVALIASSARPVVATVRSGALDVVAHPGHPACPVEVLELELPRRRVHETSFSADEGATDLTWASTVFCAGVGLGEDGIDLLKRCARQAGASIAGTRRVCELGWLPRRQQVGLTGHSIAPELYVGAGVRGAFEHLTGIRRAATVVAINNDPEAAIFEACDYGVVGDVRTLLPLLAARLAAASPDEAARPLQAVSVPDSEESRS